MKKNLATLIAMAAVLSPMVFKDEDENVHDHKEPVEPITKFYPGKSEHQITGTTSSPDLENVKYNG